MKTMSMWTVVGLVTMGLSACGGSGGVLGTAQGAFGAVRTYTVATNAGKMAKDLRNAVPAFQGFDAAVPVAKIKPRDEDAPADLALMFEQNMIYLLDATAGAIGAPLRSCASRAACSGRLLVLQFTEDDYGGNVIEKFTIGDKLRGRLSYIDADSGEIIYEQRVEAVSNYGDVMKAIKAQLSVTLMRSYPADDMEAATDRIDAIEPVAARYDALKEMS